MADTSALRRWTPIAVAVSLLAMVAILLWFQGQRDVDIVASLARLDGRIVAAALGLHVLSHVLWSLRIGLLGRGLGVAVGPLRALAVVTAGQFAAAVTPGRMGAEPFRIALLTRQTRRLQVNETAPPATGAQGTPAVLASRTVLADRATDMILFVILGATAAFLLPELFGSEATALRVAAFSAAGLLFGLVVLFFAGLTWPTPIAAAADATWNALRRLVGRPRHDVAAKVAHFLAEVRTGILALAVEKPWRVVVAALLSVLIWTAEYGVLWTLVAAVGDPAPVAAILAAGVLLTMIAALPVSLGGAGVAELAAVLLLAPWTGNDAAIVVLLWRGTSYYYDLAVGGASAAWQVGRWRKTAWDAQRSGRKREKA